MDWKSLGFYVLDRFKEPSTYLGIGGLIVAAHIKVDPDTLSQVGQLAMVLASTLGVVLKEGK